MTLNLLGAQDLRKRKIRVVVSHDIDHRKSNINIGTEILLKTCFSHNFFHKAPPELIPEPISTKFHVDYEFNVKT